MASRMEAAVYETISAVIRGGGYDFHASASRVKFEGFMTVYTEEDEEKKDNCVQLRSLDENSDSRWSSMIRSSISLSPRRTIQKLHW